MRIKLIVLAQKQLIFNRFSYKMDFEKMNRLRDKANDYLNSRLL